MFKKLFSNLANDLVQKLPAAAKKFGNKSVQDNYNGKFNLNPKKTFQTIQTRYISDLSKNCSINKAAGSDDLYGRFLKDGADILIMPITQICNLSIKFSHFPKDCKVAKLKPLYKQGPKADPKNYRRISLLPTVSKIIEKVIHDQTLNYLTENNVLCRYQCGFCKNHSTDTSLAYLTDKILTGFVSGHSGKCSCIAKIDCGVSQESILGPLLFLLYVNDMKQAVDCDLFLYADDSCLVYQSKDLNKIERNLNKNFSDVCDWFVDNKLSIHLGEDKTKCIL